MEKRIVIMAALSIFIHGSVNAYESGVEVSDAEIALGSIELRQAIEAQDLVRSKRAIGHLQGLGGGQLVVTEEACVNPATGHLEWGLWRALHAAVGQHDLAGPTVLDRIARILVLHGSDVNAVDAGGFTPLHRAIEHGNMRLIAFFLAHGADPSITANNGQDCVHLACQMNNFDLVSLLTKLVGTVV